MPAQSRAVLAPLRLQGLEQALDGVRILYLEDLRQAMTLADKLWLVTYALWFPHASGVQVDGGAPAVVFFTSGSEGTPKGVVISHAAMLANMKQLGAALDFGPDDNCFSALPLFHTLGLTACALMPLTTGTRLFLYASPMHYRTIPGIVYETRETFLFGTSTFLGHYGRMAHPVDFQTVRKAICGGEKLSAEAALLWHAKFGIRMLEGYVATECGPAMSLNTPLSFKPGAVGRLLPGIVHRLIPVAGIPAGGVLHPRGPNSMSGYLLASKPGAMAGTTRVTWKRSMTRALSPSLAVCAALWRSRVK
jgi:acyl-[acyl-carrier-protein]-phospholipid O-acyltransferase/long-chain-fatty-acid--[acyl-carrier-protein] ligase